MLALFGAPIAHEDDAERAVRCALAMQAAMQPVATSIRARYQIEPSIRVGVNTGEVVSGTWDASGRQDVAVTGDAVNTAARIQAAGEPGEVLTGAETMRLSRQRIRYGEKRELMLKGKTDKVPVYPATGLRDRFGERWETSEGATPLIGRDREVGVLLDAWARAQRGDGQLVTLIGDAGVGKSRLIAEMIDRVTTNSTVWVLRGRCLSYGQEIALWLIASLLRSLLGIGEADGLVEARAKLVATLSPLLVQCDTETQAEALDVLGEVLGLPPGHSRVAQAEPEIRRQALVRSLKLLLGILSERTATILVLEDMHWADTASQEVLKEILSDVPGLRMLVLVAQRSGWEAPWSERDWAEAVTLQPLGRMDAALLATAVLGGATIAPELEAYVGDRAGGNPFFVEELLRALAETGGLVERAGEMTVVPAVAERIPVTLTEVLLARLDRLDGPVRTVAQVASVIGRTFAVRLLAQVMGQDTSTLELPLSALQRAEIAFPWRRGDLEYVFKHVTMRDVAYHTLVRKRRRQLHLQAARAIATLYPSDEYIEMIAYHYGQTEAPEAAEWLEKAGDRAAAVYANEEARGHYREALRRVTQQGAQPSVLGRLNEKIGVVLSTIGQYDAALGHLQAAVDTGRAERDLQMAGRVIARMGMVHRFRGTPEEGIALVSPMINLLARSGSSECLAALHMALASLLFLLGRYSEQQVAAERAADIAGSIGDRRLVGEAEERRATALVALGQTEEALEILQGAIPLIEAGGDLMALFRTLNNAAAACAYLGRMADARRYLEQALAVTERIGGSDQTAFLLGYLGGTLIVLGDWVGARAVLERARGLLGEERTANAAPPLAYLGQLALYSGEWDEADRVLREALRVARQTGQKHLVVAQASLAELKVLTGRPEEAIALVEKLAIVKRVELSIPVVLAWAALEAGAMDRAATVVEDAVHRARDEGHRLFLVAALRVQGMVLHRQGRHQEAARILREGLDLARILPFPCEEARIQEQRGQVEEALAIFQRLGAKKDVERLERVLDATHRALPSRHTRKTRGDRTDSPPRTD